MERNQNIQKEKLFDGLEEDMIKFSFTLNGKEIKISEFLNNSLRNLVKDEGVSQEDFEKIVEAGNFEKKGTLIKNYYSQEHLEIYYLINNGQIYLFAFGEFQPARYILYIEGAWYL
ncbi:hypothetical protein ABXT08_12165 [Chryseobacterium sp. NRRL B-14859]|uniref:hypothetical protein n=1 Tax=unclassified Chryseobacterium TaxID=2593645 RepID=UPI000F451343|nr:hypothetical protein [Chryseobacterium sp. G0240]ROI05091.1 hypothetical protein EGI16_07145 [Chryseobacterium sp. G0240]